MAVHKILHWRWRKGHMYGGSEGTSFDLFFFFFYTLLFFTYVPLSFFMATPRNFLKTHSTAIFCTSAPLLFFPLRRSVWLRVAIFFPTPLRYSSRFLSEVPLVSDGVAGAMEEPKSELDQVIHSKFCSF